jgi:hypothetical protein
MAIHLIGAPTTGSGGGCSSDVCFYAPALGPMVPPLPRTLPKTEVLVDIPPSSWIFAVVVPVLDPSG